MELWRLVAHSHWITLRVFGRRIRLCARCTGYVAGFLAMMASRALLGMSPLSHLGPRVQMATCFLLLAPLAVDWLTQSWGWRESRNGIRLLTGIFLGVGVALFLSVKATTTMKVGFYFYTAALIALVGRLGKIRCGTGACS
jgi:uncharacterized membrane protein